MGIYINMERPKDCWHCRFADPEEGGCLVDQKTHGDWDEPDECPIIPTPPHGRLIDADALVSLFQEGQCYFAGNIKYKIADMPTIIPAEEEDYNE